MEKGIVYLMTTGTNGLVKIGRTMEKQFEERMRELETNGYRNVGTMKRCFAILVDDYKNKEDLLHKVFGKSQIGDTELFAVDVNIVKQLMSSMEGTVVYPTQETKEEIYNDAADAVQSSNLPDGKYTYSKSKTKYHGILVCKNGELTLLKGSMLSPKCGVLVKGYENHRNNLPLKDNEELLEDEPMSSVSEAASLIAGNDRNGWTCWKNSFGDYIDVYRNREE